MTGEVIAKPGSGGEPSGDQGGGAGSPTIAAQGTAFNTSELAFKAETPTPLVFDNQDDAAVTGPHNVSIYDGDAELFTGDLINGPQQVTYDIPALKPGGVPVPLRRPPGDGRHRHGDLTCGASPGTRRLSQAR